MPPLPAFAGTDKDGVFTLRTLDDARAIRAYACGEPFGFGLWRDLLRRRAQAKWRRTAGDVRSAVVIGGGLLGLETARALLSQGLCEGSAERLDVSVLERAPYLLPQQLDAEGGQVLQKPAPPGSDGVALSDRRHN